MRRAGRLINRLVILILMSLFVGRDAELSVLEGFYSRKGAQLVVVWGRRRVGKTELCARFAAGKPAAYHLCRRVSLPEGPRLLAREFAKAARVPAPEVNGWAESIGWVAESLRRRGRKPLVILDEFPYLIEGDRAVLSEMQKAWDERLSKAELMLVLTGSSVGMMETHVLGYRSPLYGRRTGQIRVGPLPFVALQAFYPRWKPDDVVRAFSVLGGIPAYLEKFEPGRGLMANIREHILARSEFLYEEPEIMLRQELREPARYFDILECIAGGSNRMSEISSVTGIPISNLPKYLRVLVGLGVLERRIPVTERRPRARTTAYHVSDHFMRFWFAFVAPSRSLVEGGQAGNVVEGIRMRMDSFVGPAFEDIAREHLLRLSNAGELSIRLARLGRWWQGEREVDLVGLDASSREAAFFEVKWSDLKERECLSLLHRLEAVAAEVPVRAAARRFGVVAREVQGKAALRRAGFLVFDLEDILSAPGGGAHGRRRTSGGAGRPRGGGKGLPPARRSSP